MADEITMMSRMRHRITLQSPDLTAESGGQFAVSWEDVATVWAVMKPIKSRALSAEALFAEQLVAKVSHEVTLRFRDGVSAEMRVVFDGRYFNIRSVVNTDESGQWLRLLVEENAAI